MAPAENFPKLQIASSVFLTCTNAVYSLLVNRFFLRILPMPLFAINNSWLPYLQRALRHRNVSSPFALFPWYRPMVFSSLNWGIPMVNRFLIERQSCEREIFVPLVFFIDTRFSSFVIIWHTVLQHVDGTLIYSWWYRLLNMVLLFRSHYLQQDIDWLDRIQRQGVRFITNPDAQDVLPKCLGLSVKPFPSIHGTRKHLCLALLFRLVNGMLPAVFADNTTMTEACSSYDSVQRIYRKQYPLLTGHQQHQVFPSFTISNWTL